MIAYVDESLRLDGAGRYVLAAVLVPDSRADEVRAALRSMLRRGQRRYHWHTARSSDRAAAVSAFADLDLHAVVVTTVGFDSLHTERARRRCLRQLLWELSERDVREVVLESRRHRDAADRQMIAHAQRSGWAPLALRYGFSHPDQECLLWLPDIVAGATARVLAQGEAAYADLLARMTVVTAP